MRVSLTGLAVALCLLATPIFAESLIPERRMILSDDTDRPGGDIASAFDTTLEACERACLTNAQCTAFTFNTRNGSCFSKASPGAPIPFVGALSGRVTTADPAAVAGAGDRRAELTFIPDWDIAAAFAQAQGLASAHTSGEWTAQDHLQSAAEAEDQGDAGTAAQFTGAALNISDAPGDWNDYARRLILWGEQDTDNQRSYRERALNATINGTLRASDSAQRHTLLVTMADALEKLDRGADGVKALRLAQSLQPRDDTASLLATFAAKYGFRIVENAVQSDSARPRICATFSEYLVPSGVDYSSFVQLPEPGLTVAAAGPRQLCIEGVAHGARYAITFREGLPAADGQTLAESTALTQYVRDRNPGVRFPGRGYVLPATGTAALPVETVNTTTLDLALYAVSDRNLLRAIQSEFFGKPIQDWQEADFDGRVGAQIWTGTATISQTVNRDVTTRLPLDDAVTDLGAGVYVLRAAVPGVDPYAVPAAWQWFVISDLGLTTMSGVDGLHVFVRSLGSAEAKPGITVDLLSEANAVLGTATTDNMGYARFDAGLARGTGGTAAAMVVARDGDADLAFLSLTDPEFDLSDRGVEGREASPPVDVFLATDRGAYRAGETIHATALARDAQTAAIEALPLTAILKRPDGVEYSRALAQDSGAGGHVFALPVAGSAPRGVWRLEVLADLEAAPLATQTVLVEDFLPERIDFDVTLAEAPLRLGSPADLTVQARYLFGAPGADLAVEGEVLVRAATAVAGYEAYSFGRHDTPFDAAMQPFTETVRTDDAGTATIAATLPAATDPGRPLEARFTVRVAEGSGRPVERQITEPLAASAPMIGIRPLFEDVVSEGTDARFALVALDANAAPMAMPVRWELTRVQTDYQWYSADGNWNWEPVTSRERVSEGTADLTATGAVDIAAPVEWGEYELTVERAGGTPAASSIAFYAGWYAPADASATPDTLELSLDKPAYKPGDTATLRIVPRAAGTALITVLSNRLIAMKAVAVTEGENTITLPVTDEWGAGVYVTASVLRPMDAASGRNPARALGLTHAGVDPGARQLKATIETAPEAAPRGPLEVAVKVDGLSPGDTAWATIAAVDEGILNLTAYEAPDPADHYFGQRKLGVGIRDIYGRLIDGMNGAEGQVRSGGDAGAQAKLMAPPPTEELVAYFSGPLQVGPDGYARAIFDLPSFNGNVRVMAVVWSKTGVGQAQADVLVRDPVVVTASLPRFMAPGDESRLLLELVHATGPSGRVGLDVTGRGVTLGEAPSGVDLTDLGKASVRIPVTAGDPGIQTIDVTATTPDGRALAKPLTLPVQLNDPEIARTSRFDLAAGQTFTFDSAVFTGLIPGSGTATMAIGPIARLNAPGLLASLDRYPYGCTEQITSRALPLLYLNAVAQAVAVKGDADIAGRIDEAITEVLANQTAEGAFGLWSPASGDFWLDAFVTDFLSRARAQGHAVPDLAFRSALDNLRNQVNTQADFDAGGEALAYALMVLAREGAAAIGDLRYYADVKGDAFSTPMARAQLGSALASYGDQTRADTMFRRAADLLDEQAPDTEQVYRADYGTHYRDTAAVLALAVESGSQAVDREALVNRIATNASTLSTQEATWALLAANALIDGQAADGITLDGQPATGPLVRVLDGDAATPVAVQNTTDRPTTITVTTYGVASEPEPAGGNGYAITRSYYAMDGTPATLDGITTGTRLIAVLDVTPFARGEARLMVSDPLPAGFEIDNPNLISGGEITGMEGLELTTEVANSEFRQDRFLTAIDRFDNQPFRLGYIVRAVSPGTFRHPAASVEDMYRPDFRARTDTGTVTIAE